MKTLEIAKATKPLSDYARGVDDHAVLVVKNGKPVAVLSSARGMDAESIALANNPKFASIIKRARKRQEKEGSLSLAQVRQRLGLNKSTRSKNSKQR